MELLTGLAVATAGFVVAVFTAWLSGVFKQFLPSPQRARLALANAFEARLPLPQQRFRLVLCWLGNDSAGRDTGTVAEAFTSIEGTGRVNVFETTWFSIYCSDSTPSTRCNDDRSSGGRGRATTACCESSGVPVVGPGASWRVVFDGGLIHTAVGKVSGRGGPLTNRSGCAA